MNELTVTRLRFNQMQMLSLEQWMQVGSTLFAWTGKHIFTGFICRAPEIVQTPDGFELFVRVIPIEQEHWSLFYGHPLFQTRQHAEAALNAALTEKSFAC